MPAILRLSDSECNVTGIRPIPVFFAIPSKIERENIESIPAHFYST
ncbi:hypothetical protein LAG90_08910 [Marinilongibacter aquaticus]|nr:hypothetical protein [Marinilongibacter aquaticus]UBM60753.1 hypothetical protein LAG90_08910 [Marinilongibacter aquaticus]